MSTEEARNLITKDSSINNTNLLALMGGGETALHSHASGVGGGGFTSRCSVYLSGVQTIPNETLTVVEFDTERFDGDGEWDTANYKFVVGTTGYYQVNYQLRISALATNVAFVIEVHIDDVQAAYSLVYTYEGARPHFVSLSKLIYFEAGDEIKFKVLHNAGGNETLYAEANWSCATIHRVS